MAFGSFNDKAGRSQMHSMADVNVTPMVDVMLVLLVIFIIAAPLMTPAIKWICQVRRRPVSNSQNRCKLRLTPQSIILSAGCCNRSGRAGTPLPAGSLPQPQPDLQLRADKSTRYDMIAQLMAAAQAAGAEQNCVCDATRDGTGHRQT
jgi:biopolymer transport protein ExbD